MKHIVYIHGLASTAKIFSHLNTQLPNHKATFIEYSSVGSIEESYKEVLSKMPDGPVTIIGHSLGGVLAYLLAIRDDHYHDIQRLVTISSPFGGSDAATKLRWFYPRFKIFRDLSFGSPIVKEITTTPNHQYQMLSLVSTAGGLPFIMGANDGVVTVESQCAIPATKRVHIHSNHCEILQDEVTINEVKNFVF